MQPGDVIFFKDFLFSDGTRAPKWFVVLNYTDEIESTLLLKTTSQPNRYQGCSRGCNKASNPVFFAPCDWQTCFTLDTYIQIPWIIPYQTAEVDRLIKVEVIKPRGSLTNDCWAQLKSCLATFKDDIAPTHWTLIYK